MATYRSQASRSSFRWRSCNDGSSDETFDDLLRAIRRHVETSDEARKCFQYLHRNRQRMSYPKFEAEALCVGSGVVETGCKVVVSTRLKRAGMRWTAAGSNAILALRCSKLSGRFQDFGNVVLSGGRLDLHSSVVRPRTSRTAYLGL
jgi:hypothetical protein